MSLRIHADGLLDEGLIRQDTLVQRPCIFGQTQRGESALLLGQISRIDAWMRNGHSRFLRIDIDRAYVQFKFRLDTEQKKAANPVDANQRTCLEHNPYPVGVFVSDKGVALAVDPEFGLLRTVAECNGKRAFQNRAIPAKRVLRADEFGGDRAAVALYTESLSARMGAVVIGACCIKRKGSLGAPDIRHTHCRKNQAPVFLRWEGNRDPQDIAEDTVFCKDVPERFSFAEKSYVCPAKRYYVLADMNPSRGSADIG